jgi:hypothetical protein
MFTEGFEPAFPGSERPWIHAVDRAITGIGTYKNGQMKYGTEIDAATSVGASTRLDSGHPSEVNKV